MRQDAVSKVENKPDNVRLDTLFRLFVALDLALHLVPKEKLKKKRVRKKAGLKSGKPKYCRC